MVSFVPVLISQSNISNGGVASWTIFTRRVPNSVRKLTQIPSTDVEGCIDLFSIRIVMRAHCSSNVAWFGQHSMGAGSLGGATRLDRSSTRQSPRGSHGGYRQLSCSAGTQTSCDAHTFVTFVAKQFLRPHHTFEHFAFPFAQMHELQLCSLSMRSGCLPASIAWYGDNDVVFRHTELGSDKTVGKFNWIQLLVHLMPTASKNSQKNLRISHLDPRRPLGQMQVKPPMPSMHVAPPRHGCGEHSFTLIRQSGPENPCAQTHRNQPGPDSQVPPLWHGWSWHWSIDSAYPDCRSVHNLPANHIHRYSAQINFENSMNK